MPKHAPTFKHLVGTVHATRDTTRPDRTVNDLLGASRQGTPRDVAPHLARTWANGTATPVVDIDSTDVHPAELLRREREAHARAARRVAGPAPPRSWQPKEAAKPDPRTSPVKVVVSGADMLDAAAIVHPHPPRLPGVPSLVSTCTHLVLQLLRDTTVVWDSATEDPAAPSEVVTLSEAMLAGVLELDTHLIGTLLSASSLLPGPPRLSDRHLRALFEQHASGSEAEEDDWDAGPPTTLAHLALTAHPSPLPLLRGATRAPFLALTSLDLAFCTLPTDLTTLADLVPPGLRALGLAGVCAAPPQRQDADPYAAWPRGLTALARRLRVLQTLDMSYGRLQPEISIRALWGGGAAPPHAPPVTEPETEEDADEWGAAPTIPTLTERRVHPCLPSLRTLGLRGVESDRRALRSLVQASAGRWVDVIF